MKLYVVRHSRPEAPDDNVVLPDEALNGEFDPGLTDEGRDLVAQLAKWMLENEEIPNAIYASPMQRTQETAEILRDAFGLDNVKMVETIKPKASIKGLVQKLAADDDTTKPMIVSHHETIESGLRELDDGSGLDQMAQSEMRIFKVKRKNGRMKEQKRVLPSDIDPANTDHYG